MNLTRQSIHGVIDASAVLAVRVDNLVINGRHLARGMMVSVADFRHPQDQTGLETLRRNIKRLRPLTAFEAEALGHAVEAAARIVTPGEVHFPNPGTQSPGADAPTPEPGTGAPTGGQEGGSGDQGSGAPAEGGEAIPGPAAADGEPKLIITVPPEPVVLIAPTEDAVRKMERHELIALVGEMGWDDITIGTRTVALREAIIVRINEGT